MSICHLRVPCNFAAWEVYAMPILHAISELVAHMACPHYMQAWNLHGICHAIIICKPWRLLDYMPYPHYMQFSSLLCTCHAIIIYNFWACGIYAMPSLHVILELMRHMPYQHFMQVWGGWGICHTIIEYIFWACEACDIASNITVNYIVLVHITLYCIWLHYIAFQALQAIWVLSLGAFKIYAISSLHSILEFGWAYAMLLLHVVLWLVRYVSHIVLWNSWAYDTCPMPSLYAILELAWQMTCHHYM